jgi:uracil phosphoribosyltransferase
MDHPNLHIVDHPLAQHLVTRLRAETTPPAAFRVLCKRLTSVLAFEASRNLRTRPDLVRTPLEQCEGRAIDEELAAVVILRAGLGMLDPVVEMFPEVSVGYVGLERDETTAVASSYYAKLPPDIGQKTVFLLDPMLATGGSAARACDIVKAYHPRRIVMLSVVAAPEGVRVLQERHPDVAVFTASLDRELNNKSYILPGLGDFGDRLYGT